MSERQPRTTVLNLLKSPRSRRYRDLPLEPTVTEAPFLSPRPISRDWTKRFRDRVSRVFDREFEVGVPEHDPEVEQMEGELQRSKGAHQHAVDEGQQLDKEIEEVRGELAQMEQRRKMSGETMKQLTLAQRFLSTADTLSQAEIVRAMEIINEETFQLASVVADTIQLEQKSHVHAEARKKYLSRVLSALGPGFLDIVEHKILEDVLAIQIGWQAILVDWCSKVIMVWLAGDFREFNQYLHGAYQRIMATNDQPIAGRWRTIARMAADKISPPDRERLFREVIDGLTALPILCGYITRSKDYEDLWNAFYQRLGPLLDKCLELRKVLGEGVTSTDIRTYSLDSGYKYNPRYMDLEYEDEEGDPRGEKKGVIACSLSLGLFRTKRSRNADGQFSDAQEAILKPKVILQSTLREIIS